MLIRNAAVYNGRNFDRETDVRLLDGRITETGRNLRPEAGENVTDLGGDFLLPGFVDVHIHGCAGRDTMRGEQDVRAMSRRLAEEGHFGLLEILTHQAEADRELPNLIRSRHVDGLILLGQPGKEYYRMIARCGTPVVFLDFYDEHGNADAVVGDNTYGAYRLTSHLIRLGHTRIGFVGNQRATSSIMDRYLGYYRAMLVNNLPVRDDWILMDRTDDGELTSITLPEELPTAFVCNCDVIARKLISALREAGKRVPEDVSVTGFDDFEIGPEQKPALSTFRVNITGMIDLAVNAICDRCAGTGKPFGRTVVGGQPVYRDSERPLTEYALEDGRN